MKNSIKLQKVLLSAILFSNLVGCSLFHSSKKEPQLKNIYDVLKIECNERNQLNDYSYLVKGMNQHMLSCCLESVEEMQKHNYQEATPDEKDKPTCNEKGTHIMQFKCPGTLAWCEKDKE